MLLIAKPTNIAIKELTGHRRPSLSDQDQKEDLETEKLIEKEGVPDTGALIGSSERLILMMFAVLGKYAAMALVITAKSMARYTKISKSPAFSEYYLLGTLLSLSTALLVGVFLRYFLEVS